MSSLKLITETCVPRPDVLGGGLTEEHFAAQLDQVVRAPADSVYGDAAEFFRISYPTRGLQELLNRTFGRLSGKPIPGAEHGVIRSETSFGGGKTHGLIAVYHLASGARPLAIDEFVNPELLPDDCAVAAVVADRLDPINGLRTNGFLTKTLWGEIGAQLGEEAYHKVRLSDERLTAPGKGTIEEMVGRRPTVIIIDELAMHLRQLASSGSEDVRRLAEAVPVFLKNLFEAAASTPRLVVILTLATQRDAFGKETNDLAQLLNDTGEAYRRAVDETLSVVSRSTSGGSIVQPADDAEIAEILKRRLFARIDSAAAAASGVEYQSLYERLAARGERLSGGADQPATYRALVESSYPFHPELIRVLDKRIGTIPDFQRARGALKLLAEVVHRAWQQPDPACEILNVADIDYDNPAVLRHLTFGLRRNEFEGVAKADLAGPASHTAMVDTTRFAGRAPYATRAARTVFAHSLELVKTAGAGRSDYLLGTMRVDDDPDVIGEALAEAEKVAWYLDYDGARWRFTTEPNANKIIAEEAANVPNTLVNAEVQDRIVGAFPSDGLVKAVHFPTGPAGVEDRDELRLVVMHHDDLAVRAAKALPPPTKVVEILDRHGLSQAVRTYRNSLVFLVADPGNVDDMRERVRFDLAAQRIASDPGRMQAQTPEVQKRLRQIADAAKLDAAVAVARCYRHLYFPAADKANGYLRHEELAPKTTGDTGSISGKHTKAIVAALRDDYSKIRSTELSTDYLRQKAWPVGADEVTTKQVADAFWSDHGAQIILDPHLLKDAIRAGVKNGSWLYWDSKAQKAWGDKDPAPPVELSVDATLYTPEKALELGLTGRALRWDDIAAVLNITAQISGTDLRAALETALGKEPAKSEITELLARNAEGDNPRVVVVGGPASAGAKAAPPSDIRKISLDTVTVLTTAEADRLSIVLARKRTGDRIIQAQGSAGVAFQTLADKAADTPGVIGFAALQVTAAAEPGEGYRDIERLGQAIPMLPKHAITVAVAVELDFNGLSNGVEITVAGPAKDWQRIEDEVARLAKKASGIAGTITIDFAFDPPAPAGDQRLEQVRKALVTVDPGDTRLKGTLA